MNCPNEVMLSSYLDKKLPEAEQCQIESHIARCQRCLDLLMVAQEAQGPKFSTPPRGARGRSNNTTRARKWLIGALILFALSFIFKRYFLQCLVGAAILGFKWVMEGEGAKKVVMIFKGMKEEEKVERGERKRPARFAP